LSAKLGMRTVDVGAPQLSMHSIREMCATEDVKNSVELFTAFLRDFAAVDAKLRVD
jgi:aspartyl aminopeptidase